jgi:hypothetical protein
MSRATPVFHRFLQVTGRELSQRKRKSSRDSLKFEFEPSPFVSSAVSCAVSTWKSSFVRIQWYLILIFVASGSLFAPLTLSEMAVNGNPEERELQGTWEIIYRYLIEKVFLFGSAEFNRCLDIDTGERKSSSGMNYKECPIGLNSSLDFSLKLGQSSLSHDLS